MPDGRIAGSGENGEEGRARITVLSTNAAVAKILRDGKVELIPTSELYAVRADEKIEGIQVDDPTITGPTVAPVNAIDRAEREFNMAERGDAISARHAQGSASPLGRKQEPAPLKLEAGVYEKEEEERVQRLTG